MEFKQIIRERYSCRKIESGKAVEDEKLCAVLEAGRLSPTAKNLQEQHIYVVRSEEGLAKIDKSTRCRYGAPVCLVVTYSKEDVFVYPGGYLDSGAEDAAIVATHMMLAATDEGLCSCWLNAVDPDILKKELEIPESEEFLMILDIGYPAEGSGPIERHFSRKELSETTKLI